MCIHVCSMPRALALIDRYANILNFPKTTAFGPFVIFTGDKISRSKTVCCGFSSMGSSFLDEVGTHSERRDHRIVDSNC